MAQADRTKDQTDAKTNAAGLGDLLGHPGFRAMIEEIENTSPDRRAQAAKRLASSAELKKRGIPVPPGGKLKIRFFDPGSGSDLATSEEQLSP